MSIAPPSIIADIVRQHAAQRPQEIAVVFEDEPTTYGELDRRANQVANGLIAAGLKPQSRVAHLDKSNGVFFELLYGCAKSNTVMVSVNWRLAAPEIAHIVNDAEAEILFVGEEYFPVVEKIRAELRSVRTIVAFSGAHPAFEAYTQWRDRQSDVDPKLPIDPEDVAVQFYTSGTTGLPKGAQITNANLLQLLPAWTPTWHMGPGVPNIVILPMFHIGGAGWALAGTYAGCTNYVMREVVPLQILRLIEERRIEVMLAVPAIILFLVQTPQIRETDLSSLKIIVYGAAPIPAELLRQALKIFPCGFQQVYG
ncbi:MAG: AMP-binding protein, partial [Reyranellaceae bacterium]